eukprot:Em0004g602a
MASDSGIQAPSDREDVASQIPFHDLCTLWRRSTRPKARTRRRRYSRPSSSGGGKLTPDCIHRRGHDGSYHGADVDGDWTHSKVPQCDDLHAVDNISGVGGRSSEGLESQRTLLCHHETPAARMDRARPAYGMKETALAKHYIRSQVLADQTWSCTLLSYCSLQEAGDFADVVLISRFGEYLDDLANGNTSKDRAGMKKALQLLLRNTSALEQKWLIRIILKGLKTGLSENSVYSVFHPDAVDLFSVCINLEKVCTDLHDRSVQSIITYFSVFGPMLGERATMDQSSGSAQNNRMLGMISLWDSVTFVM